MKPTCSMRNLFFAIVIFCYSGLQAQQTYKDSIHDYFKRIDILVKENDFSKSAFKTEAYLLEKLEASKSEEKVDILHELYINQIYKSRAKAEKYNSRSKQLSRRINYLKGELRSKNLNAYSLFLDGDFGASKKNLNAVIAESQLNPDFNNITIQAKIYKCYIYTEKGEYDKTIELALQLLDYGDTTNNEYCIMRAYVALRHCYNRKKDYKKALEYTLKSLHYSIKEKRSSHIFSALDDIARLCTKLGDVETALKTNDFFLKLHKNTNGAGDFFLSVVYFNNAELLIKRKAYKQAQNFITRALSLNYKNNYKLRIPRAEQLQAKLFLELKDTVNAIAFFEKSTTSAVNLDAFDVINWNSATLDTLYRATKHIKKANAYRLLHNKIKDSLFTDAKAYKIQILETQQKVKEISKINTVLKQKNNTQLKSFSKIIVALAFLVVFSFIGLYQSIKSKRKNKLLYEKTLETAHHELNEERNKRVLKPRVFVEKKKAIKYKKAIDSDIKKIILNKLEKLELKHFFLDSNCSLNEVAERLKTNPKYLSSVINNEKNKSFNNYVNELRINYLIAKLVSDPEFRTNKLSYIASQVGYNNLNTFNTAFKKKQGILPSYFIKELNKVD